MLMEHFVSEIGSMYNKCYIHTYEHVEYLYHNDLLIDVYSHAYWHECTHQLVF